MNVRITRGCIVKLFNFIFAGLCYAIFLYGTLGNAHEFYVGTATVEITPPKPVFLQGQMGTRISTGSETPLMASILALESRDGDRSVDSALIVSLDVCSLSPQADEKIRAAVQKVLPEFDVAGKFMAAATHTHTSLCTFENDYYVTNSKDVMLPEESNLFLGAKIAEGVKQAWNGRVQAQFSYGLGFAEVAHNRRTIEEDGRAVMYGETNSPKFRAIEGYEDHGVGCMFFWDMEDKLIAMAINVACPAQEVESGMKLNADYWHCVRERLYAAYGKDICVVPLCGAAGDLSPHLLYQRGAEARMLKLRGGSRLDEIARRIVAAVDDVYPVALKDKKSDVILVNKFYQTDLPQQIVPQSLYEEFKKEAESYRQQCEASADRGAAGPHRMWQWTKRVVDRYEGQQGVANPTYPVPIHILRIGETAIATNPFELYTDFSTQIKSRCRPLQTFLVQLCDGRCVGGYVPSERAVAGGGYGAIPQSNFIGAEGGKILTEKTIEWVNELF